MHPILRNVLAVIAGWAIGSAVNMAIIMFGGNIFPVHPDLIPGDMESIKAIMPTADVKYFIHPFLAHALGTLVGAFVVVKIAATNHLKLALLLSAIFLLGGLSMAYILNYKPVWYTLLDLLLAYIPMGYLGYILARAKN